MESEQDRMEPIGGPVRQNLYRSKCVQGVTEVSDHLAEIQS